MYPLTPNTNGANVYSGRRFSYFRRLARSLLCIVVDMSCISSCPGWRALETKDISVTYIRPFMSALTSDLWFCSDGGLPGIIRLDSSRLTGVGIASVVWIRRLVCKQSKLWVSERLLRKHLEKWWPWLSSWFWLHRGHGITLFSSSLQHFVKIWPERSTSAGVSNR